MFLYMLCNIGSENFLKKEVSLKFGFLKLAYSRKGFLTFKNEDSQNFDIKKIELIFARRIGICFGKIKKEDFEKRIEEIKGNKKIQYTDLKNNKYDGENGNIGEEILEVISSEENEYWIGSYKVKKYSWSCPGANPNLQIPEKAPSRAFLKFEEAILWSKFNLDNKKVALELGAAPGGSVYAMLKRNIFVYGVDMGDISEICMKHSNFKHIKLPMQKLDNSNLPYKIDILVCDVNLAPEKTIPFLIKIINLRSSISALFYTMKIGENFNIENIKKYISQIRKCGFNIVKATQLPSNRSEIFIFAIK